MGIRQNRASNQNNQLMHEDTAKNYLMADMYFGTPMNEDNNSGEFNVIEASTQENTIE